MSSKTPLPFPHAGASTAPGDPPEHRALFHRLNNQLGIVLANAELLESRLDEQDADRARAAQIVAGVIDAISTAQEIKALVTPSAQ